MAKTKILDVSDEAVDDRIADMMRAATYKPDVEAFVVAAMHEFGGPGGLAKCLKEDYDLAHDRNQVNVCSSILKTIVELMKVAAEKSKADTREEELTPAELRAAMRRMNLDG